MKNGTAQVVGDTDGNLTTAFAGEKVTVSGENGNPGVTKFGGWKVISPESFELTEEQKNTEENMTFTMPASPVELKASYSFPASVVDMPVIVTGGTIRVGEGESQTGTVLVQPGQTVTIEANEPANENESFHYWKVENGTSTAFAPTEGSLGSETEKGTEKIVFTMPQDGVKLTAVYSIPDETPDPDAGYDASSAAGGAIAAVAVGGAAIWGGYEIATRVILHSLLPEDAAIPANRGQLALLVWNTAGRPEPAGAPAFADVADPDMAKAAQWCTEQGTMGAKGDCFEPEGWTPKFKVIEVWNKAFPKQ